MEDNEDPSVPEQPVFDLTGAGDDPCSSSNEGESELEGEFTGKFRVVSVPTKADPPTSATRERIEQWGRPLSPFPRNVPDIPEDDSHSDGDLPLQPLILTQQEEGHIPEANEDSPAKEQCDAVTEVHAVTTLQDDLNSAPIDLDVIPSTLDGEEQSDEVFIEQTLSEEPQPSNSPEPQTPAPQAALEECIEADEPMAEAADTDSEGDCSDESDLSVVKIVSDDPWAAARAAAILKQVCSSYKSFAPLHLSLPDVQHDWDLVTKIARSRRLSPRSVESLIRKARRADLTSAGVSKSSSPARSVRRSFGVVVDGRVVTANSPSMTLPELLSEAESELDPPTTTTTFLKRGQQTPRTPSPAPSSFRQPEAPLVIDTDGPREWSRSDWKLLDACFTDARLEIGARWGSEGTLGDVDAVDLEDVVDRFVDIFGGAEVVSGLGPSFERYVWSACLPLRVLAHNSKSAL